jgi:hypothetical protein
MPETQPPELELPAGIPPEIAERLSSVDRKLVLYCVLVMGVLGVASAVGMGFSLYLVNHYPLLLVALSPIGRHMVLVAPAVDPVAFVLVIVVRRTVFYFASFQMGCALGPVAVDWLKYRSPRTGRFIGWLQVLFTRASVAAVFFLPGPAMSTIAGSVGMRTRIFLPLTVFGLVFRTLLVIEIAEWFREPIEVFLAWADAYWIPGTVLMFAVMALYQWKGSKPSGKAAGS